MSKTGMMVAGAGVAGAAWLAYNCYSPASQLYGRTLTHCANPKHLALTYDDGPNDVHTERLLEVLARHDVKATFFLIGKFVAARPQIARAVVAGGHLVANHTTTHPSLLFQSRPEVREQLSDCSKAISDVTGVLPRFFRPPFGARRPAVLQVARELELEPVMWSATCYDWRSTATAETVERHARRTIEHDHTRGHIILLHDGSHLGIGGDRGHTVQATENLISRYRKQYYFRRVDEI